MFTVYEYAGSLLLIVTGTTLLFMACVMVLVLIEEVNIVAHRLSKPYLQRHSAEWKMDDS